MSDLFHPDAPFEFIDMVFNVIVNSYWHTFMVLTKRPERMLEFCKRYYAHPSKAFSNLWLGVSVEDQKTADERIPLLLQTPAAVRFISAEPLLEEINLIHSMSSLFSDGEYISIKKTITWTIDWVICGGESGKNARSMHPDWARSLRDQCKENGFPFFFKQWGEWFETPIMESIKNKIKLMNKDGSQWTGSSEFTFDGRSIILERVGKKKAGRLLDGIEYNEFPNEIK